MTGDARVRRCDHCARDVHDLSELTAAEAKDLLEATAWGVCVTFLSDAAGNLIAREPASSRRRLPVLGTA